MWARGGQRLVARLRQVTPTAVSTSDAVHTGVFAITGGLGGRGHC